jgi:PadR family transcriptional regulator PadR
MDLDLPGDASALDAAQRKFQKELASGTVALVLLAVLDRAGQPMYGYQIARRLEADGGALANKQSALYPVLRNLDAARFLESEVEPSIAGPPRRYYRITPLGREVLAAWIATWTATRRAVDSILEDSKP